jgi:sigma-B regulation protein RsbU (phosphoserine phosphatase)
LKGTLSTRLIVWVGVPAALLFALVVGFGTARSYQQVAKNAERSSRALAKAHASKIEVLLREAQKIPEMMAVQLERGDLGTDEKLQTYMREVLERNRGQVYGSCVAFKPRGFAPDLNGYAPYYYWAKDGLQFEQLAKPEYNYFQWDWYRLPRDAGRPLWSEPYFDDGGGQTLMITYSVPFLRDGLFHGIVTIDIALAELLGQVQRIAQDEEAMLGKGGYAFIISKQGKFLAFPGESAEHVMEHELKSRNPELAARMQLGREDVMKTRSPHDGQQAWIAFAPILVDPFGDDASAPGRSEMSLGIVSVEAGAMDPATQLLTRQVLIGIGGLAALFGAIVLVARSISRPIRELSDAAKEIAHGNLEMKIAAGSNTDEVQHLTTAFNKMTRDLRMQMQELRYTTTIRERLEGELSAARSIQMSLLPKTFPAFPDRPEIDIHAIIRPAREVGGDLYDFFFLDDQRLGIVIGDVAGKGVPAALVMAVTKSLVKATALTGHDAGEIISRVNDELCEEVETGMFVTLFFAILHTHIGELEYCNAGHLSPFLLRSDGTMAPLDDAHGPALALLDRGHAFPTARHSLKPGDVLFFCTDGVTEALSKSSDFYEPQRLQIILREVHALPVEEITRAVVQDVFNFCGECEQADDISVMALRWLGVRSVVENAPLASAAAQG